MLCSAWAPACTLSFAPLLTTSTRSCPTWEPLSLPRQEKETSSAGRRTPSAAGLCKPSGSVSSQIISWDHMPNTSEPGVPGVLTSARRRPGLQACPLRSKRPAQPPLHREACPPSVLLQVGEVADQLPVLNFHFRAFPTDSFGHLVTVVSCFSLLALQKRTRDTLLSSRDLLLSPQIFTFWVPPC